MKSIIDWTVIKPWKWFLRQTPKVKIAVVVGFVALGIIGNLTEPKETKTVSVNDVKETTTTNAEAATSTTAPAPKMDCQAEYNKLQKELDNQPRPIMSPANENWQKTVYDPMLKSYTDAGCLSQPVTSTTAAPTTTTTAYISKDEEVIPGVGETCEDLRGMYDAAMDTYNDKSSGLIQNRAKASAALSRAMNYQRLINQYC